MAVNNIPYDFQSITMTLNTSAGQVGTFSAQNISYEATIDREGFHGSSRYQQFVTEGVFEGEGSITIAKAEFGSILEFCRNNQLGYGQIVFSSISVVYGFTGQPTRTDELEEVRLAGVSQDHESGPDVLVVELPLHIGRRILFEGVPPFVE
jgi:hypothetical protein